MCRGYICSNCGTSTGGSSVTDSYWGIWTGTAGTATTMYPDRIWTTWVSTVSNATTFTANTDIFWGNSLRAVAQRQETRAERDARLRAAEEREAEYNAREAERAALRAEAEKKAEETMLALLDDDQRSQYAADKSFYVTSRSGKRYRVQKAWADNLLRLSEAGEVEETYCVHVPSDLPVCDNMTAQLLQLRFGDEEALRSVAHRRPARRAA